ncbi:hypothetical protein SB717_39805, partial [Priestia sp. SIMBA_032]|uniref:hypothetical protein n=1 Tax=Priestia sp. SIMBA_032 TaxID=3085775 RepID=UPI003978F374
RPEALDDVLRSAGYEFSAPAAPNEPTNAARPAHVSEELWQSLSPAQKLTMHREGTATRVPGLSEAEKAQDARVESD